MPLPRLVLIANPGSKRADAFLGDLDELARDRGDRPDVELVPWSVVVPRLGDLGGLSAFDRPALVRLESPGRDFGVARQLLAAADPATDWAALPPRIGWLIRPGLFYRGFVRVLEGLRASFADRPHLTPLADPRDVAV